MQVAINIHLFLHLLSWSVMCWRVSPRLDSFLFRFVCINSALSTVQFEILILSYHIVVNLKFFPFIIFSNLFLLNLHCFGDWIWKQDLMIKPYIFILLCTIDVHFNRLVFILKMTCWCSNKAEMHCVIYIVNYSKITVAGRAAERFYFFFFCEFLVSKKTKWVTERLSCKWLISWIIPFQTIFYHWSV